MTALEFLADHDWRCVVEKAIGRLDHTAIKMGIDFTVDDGRYHILPTKDLPPLNPRYRSPHLNSRNFVCAVGLTDGNWATRSASRLYHWYNGSTLATESRALRIYYDHPDEAGHLEHAIIDCTIADRIHGRVAFNGALWVREDLRRARPELGGARVMQIVSAMGRLLAMHLFDPDWIIATTPEKHRVDGISANYGWARVEPASYTERLRDSTCEACLMWSRRGDVLEEAQRIAEHGMKVEEA